MVEETYLVSITATEYHALIDPTTSTEHKRAITNRITRRWAESRATARSIADAPRDGWERRPDVVGT